MKLPERIRVRVIADLDGAPVSGAVLSIRLGMPSKNAYTVGPQIADANGRATFEGSAFVNEIQLCQKVSPMDYSGNLSDCSSLEVAVLGCDDIGRLIAARKLWGQGVPEWKLTEADLSALKRAQKNPTFANSIRVVVEGHMLNKELVLRLPSATPDS